MKISMKSTENERFFGNDKQETPGKTRGLRKPDEMSGDSEQLLNDGETTPTSACDSSTSKGALKYKDLVKKGEQKDGK
jgi:hypothetical protein